jgi:hypothetical protein
MFVGVVYSALPQFFFSNVQTVLQYKKMKKLLLSLFISLHLRRIEAYVNYAATKSRSISSSLYSAPPGMMPFNDGPGPGVGVRDGPNDMPRDLPQQVGPLPGDPMVAIGPNGPQMQPDSRGSFGGQNQFDNDYWYENPSSNWNSNSNGWNNQGSSSSKWWQSGVSNSNNLLQGNTRKTWSSQDPWNQRSSHIHLQSERPYSPLTADIDFLQGPGNTARKMRVYSEDGHARPLRANFANPSGGSRGYSNTIDVKNTGPMEFPLNAGVSQSPNSMGYGGQGLMDGSMMNGPQQQQQHYPGMNVMGSMNGGMKQMKTVQGGSLKHYSFDPYVNYVQVDIETDGMPCYAKIEVSQGPGDARQTYEVYSDDGTPWQGIVETPGYGSTILINNEGPLEYPIKASCEPIG